MTALSPEDLFHTGLVVPDVAASAQRLTDVAGYTWTNPMSFEVPVWAGGGENVLTFNLVYSVEAPHIELIQHIPGTAWDPAPHNAAHHLGYFCDSLSHTGEQLERAGFRCESYAIVDGAMAFFAYFIDPAGVRVEVVDRSVFPDWPGFLRENAASG